MLTYLIKELETIEDQDALEDALIELITNLKGEDMKGYVYIIYAGNNLYKIGKTIDLERRFKELNEYRLTRIIRTNNITQKEKFLHNKFSNKRVTPSQELFKLNDQDIAYIQSLNDEWEEKEGLF